MIDKLVVKLLTLKMRLSDEHGQDLAEYALITGGVAILLIIAVGVFSTALGGWFTKMGAWVDDLAPVITP